MNRLPSPAEASDRDTAGSSGAAAAAPDEALITGEPGPEADRPTQHLFPAILYWG